MVNDSPFIIDQEKLHVLYGSTKIILDRTPGESKGIVVRTGFNTARGSMVRSILFPKPINIKYERDGVKFIGMMAIVGVIGFTFSIVISIYECLTIPATILKSLDLGKVHFFHSDLFQSSLILV